MSSSVHSSAFTCAAMVVVLSACAAPTAKRDQETSNGTSDDRDASEQPDLTDGGDVTFRDGGGAGSDHDGPDASLGADGGKARDAGSSASGDAGDAIDSDLTPIPTSYPTGSGANVRVADDGKLIYDADPSGDTIPDFSRAGYGGGGVRIPDLPVVTALSPVANEADATARIQGAIDALAAKPLSADGTRGAILLKRGVYPLTKTLTVTASGIVLRGEGDDEHGTILRLVAGSGPAIDFEGGKKRSETGKKRPLSDSYIPVGANWFRLDDVTGLSPGDSILVVRPSTDAWIKAIVMDTHWKAGQFDVKWERKIIKIEGDRVRIDAPLTQAIDAQYGGGYVVGYALGTPRLHHVGIEALRVDSPQAIDENGNSAGSAFDFHGVENAWIRGATNDRMRGHTVKIGASKWITIQDVVSFHHPLPGPHHGASTQIFTFDGSEMLLFQRITASDGGFEFSSGGLSAGLNVYFDSQVPHGFAATAPHMKWALATLYDSLDLHQALSIQVADSSHGWTGANQVAWNVTTTSNINCDRPPTAHQWIIGSHASGKMPEPRTNLGALPCELISWGTQVQPESLYRAQLAERLGPEALKNLAAH